MKLGLVFTDRDVARAYAHRPEYPPETFRILSDLIAGPRTVLDVGAGTGVIARGLLPYVDRVDAVDISTAMIDEGRKLPLGEDPRLRWIVGTAEDAPLDPPYGLITAGAAVHWFDESRAMPRFARALAPGARLALCEVEEEPLDPSWDPEMTSVVKRYSEVRDYRDFTDVLRLLQDQGWFVREGQTRTKPVRARRTVPEYIEWQHSKATLSRVRLGDRVAAFDDEVSALFRRRGVAFMEFDVVGYITWGIPVAK
ncbi:MAG: class I SAM-dependent methyltransferase [Chloroflexota bacterium]|nr:class I SAM-dependent methyltransferase [Chloroflexota bacterium]